MTMKRVCFRSQDEVILLPSVPSVDETGNHPRPPRKPLVRQNAVCAVTGERKYAFQNQKSRFGDEPPDLDASGAGKSSPQANGPTQSNGTANGASKT